MDHEVYLTKSGYLKIYPGSLSTNIWIPTVETRKPPRAELVSNPQKDPTTGETNIYQKSLAKG